MCLDQYEDFCGEIFSVDISKQKAPWFIHSNKLF
jgi:hypothetical protein